MNGLPGGGALAGLGGSGKKFSWTWKLGFFVAASCTAAAGIIGTINRALTPFATFDFVNEVYLLIFGGLMLVIDAPEVHPRMRDVKLVIYKYLLFMTRFTGRGFWYIFLGVSIFGSLWDENISPFLGFLLGGYVVILGFASVYYGAEKSFKLERVRKAVMARGGNSSTNQYETLCPPQGLTAEDFNELANSMAGIRFSEEELQYVLNAFSFTIKADNLISREEFAEWTKGRMTVL